MTFEEDVRTIFVRLADTRHFKQTRCMTRGISGGETEDSTPRMRFFRLCTVW
jgi:hypothetical protein